MDADAGEGDAGSQNEKFAAFLHHLYSTTSLICTTLGTSV